MEEPAHIEDSSDLMRRSGNEDEISKVSVTNILCPELVECMLDGDTAAVCKGASLPGMGPPLRCAPPASQLSENIV